VSQLNFAILREQFANMLFVDSFVFINDVFELVAA